VESAVDEQLEWIEAAALSRVADIDLNMVAFPVAVTNNTSDAAASIGPALGLTPEEAMRSPHIWIGSIEQIAEALQRHRDRWGVSSWAFPATALDRVAPLIERLAGT
jgi:hypothetical protein